MGGNIKTKKATTPVVVQDKGLSMTPKDLRAVLDHASTQAQMQPTWLQTAELRHRTKPCPHCGRDTVLEERRGQYFRKCLCGYEGPTGRSAEDARRLCNMRYIGTEPVEPGETSTKMEAQEALNIVINVAGGHNPYQKETVQRAIEAVEKMKQYYT